MKLEIYQSATTYQSARFMMSKIDKSDISIDNIVVVPDKFSLLTEKMLLQLSPEGSLFNVRVKSLSALSLEVMQKLGLGKRGIISSGESLLLTQMAIENVKKDFVLFKKSNINFCYEINKLISQFKSSCVTGEDLNQSAQGVTGQKYHDLSLIYNEYQRLLTGKLDANERLRLLKESIATSDILKNTRIYFAHFDAFTKEAFGFVEVLMEKADRVGVSLAKANCVGNEYIYEKDLQAKFEKVAIQKGLRMDVVTEGEHGNAPQNAIINGLYSYNKLKQQNDGFYNVYGAGSLSAEVESVAKLIRFYTYKGSKYRDFQIAVGDLNRYQQTIEEIFDKYDIPYYIDSAVTADKTILGNFILEFLTCYASGFSKDNLIELFANILVGDKQLVNVCQNYDVEGRARYKQYVEADCPLAREFKCLEEGKLATDFSAVIKAVCEKVKDKYDEVLNQLQTRGDVKEYNINKQVFDIIEESVNLIDAYSTEKIDCGEYLKKLKLLLSFKKVSTVPTYLDSVMIGDATQSGFEEKPYLVVLGGEELPVVSGDNGLLSDEDLGANGIDKEIEPTIRMINRRNRFKLFNLLTLAVDRLFVFYQLTNSEGKRNELPAYVKCLNEMFSQSPLNVKGVFFAVSPDNEEWALLASGLKEKVCNFDHLSREDKIADAQQLMLKNNKIKVTQLESYFVCPFKHFANYGLKLKEAKRQFDQRDLGTVCHKMAELFVKQKVMRGEVDCDVKAFVNKNLDYVLETEGVNEIIQHLEEKNGLIGFLKKQMISLLKDIVKENKKSSFKPRYIEVKFDNLKLGNYQLIGKADRIDEYENYLRIVDYKTGRTGNLLKGLYYGEKLQLFLYQKVACEKFKKKAGGVFYFNAKFNYSKSDDGGDFVLKGLVENDEHLINAIDFDVDVNGKSEIAQIYKSSKGYKGAALSEYPIDKLCKYAFDVGQQAVAEIENGHISPKPNSDACQWCPYGAICGYEIQKGVRTNKDEPQF